MQLQRGCAVALLALGMLFVFAAFLVSPPESLGQGEVPMKLPKPVVVDKATCQQTGNNCNTCMIFIWPTATGEKWCTARQCQQDMALDYKVCVSATSGECTMTHEVMVTCSTCMTGYCSKITEGETSDSCTGCNCDLLNTHYPSLDKIHTC
jgi:hypothetical protein